jgi:predicted CXXCH cytochrome family protein
MPMTKRQVNALMSLCLFILISFVYHSPASAAEVNCLKCHAKLTIGKYVHKALTMGCTVCHSGIDATAVPHRKTTSLEKGLSSQQPDLCYGCHDKEKFMMKDVHPAIGMGCTVCHNPHASNYPKLLTSAVPALCYSCHDKTGFTRKIVHPPVAAGKCMTCHTPHSSDQMALLLKKPIDVCLQCHKDVPHGRHISSPQHQKEGQEQEKEEEVEPQDPARPGKPFYCGSCHDPHSTDSPLLFRFNARSMSELCRHCHKMD